MDSGSHVRGLLRLLLLVLLCVTIVPSAFARQDALVFSDDGAWSWFSDPRAHCEGSRILSGWVTTTGDIQVGALDLQDGAVTISTLEEEFGPDDHDHPVLFQTSDGRYTAFYSGHSREATHTLYRVTSNPLDVAMWTARDSTDVNTNGFHGVTYSNPLAVPGETDRIYLFWRGGGWRPAYATGTYSPATQEWTWVLNGRLIRCSSGRPYVKYAHRGDRIGFAFTNGHPRETDNNIYYAEIGKTGAGMEAFFRADGTRIKALREGPLRFDEADTVFSRLAEPESTGDDSWIWDVAFDPEGRPVVVFATFPSRRHHQYHWARYDGAVWDDRIVVRDAGGSVADTTLGVAEHHYSGGMALDPLDPTTVYVSIENWRGGWDIQRRTTSDGGLTWDSFSVTESSPEDNLRPVVPINRPDDIDMVLWMRGRYDYYKNVPLTVEQGAADSLRWPPAGLHWSAGARPLHYDTAIMLWKGPVHAQAEEGIAASFITGLGRVWPNPVRTSTNIEFSLSSPARVTLRVYDVSGRLVRILADGTRAAGRRVVVWDGLNAMGSRVASGVYLVRMNAEERSYELRVVVVR